MFQILSCYLIFLFFHRPENVPRLFDLIKVEDPKIANAFFFAVRNTLVGNTLEQATRIAYGKVIFSFVVSWMFRAFFERESL